MSPDPERLTFRVGEVSRLTGLPRSTVHDLIRRHALDSIRLGEAGVCETKAGVRRRRRSIVLVPRDALERLLEVNRTRAVT